MSSLQCIVVSPERTEMDVTAESIVLPMYDGEFGILQGHSPVIGRLGYGCLKIRKSGQNEERYFVDAGFVQVANNVVSILTDRLVPVSQLSQEEATRELEVANRMPSKNSEARAAKEKAVSRARAQLRLLGAGK
ncbi:MAG: ATP synthase F1 subunit epsilon [Planctomycetaceae bacterium]|nr:ATP synthase F1 subunit epsilon [Planctomycetaceae bacterium]